MAAGSRGGRILQDGDDLGERAWFKDVVQRREQESVWVPVLVGSASVASSQTRCELPPVVRG